MSFTRVKNWLYRYTIGQTVYTAACGHNTTLAGSIEWRGETFPGVVEVDPETGRPPECFTCLVRWVIPCVWCGEAILPGDPITLYSPRAPGFVPPEGAVLYDERLRQYVGCFRRACADPTDRMGFWMPPGGVYRVASPLELCYRYGGIIVSEDVASITGQTVIVPT